MTSVAAYAGLFLAALFAATLVPAQSESVLTAMLVSGFAPVLVIAVATAGNVLGSCINWWIGGRIERFRDRRWFPVSPPQLERAQLFYARYGRWSLLASWVPIIGDPLTLAAGLMREPARSFLFLVTLAKGGRYIVLALLVLYWT